MSVATSHTDCDVRILRAATLEIETSLSTAQIFSRLKAMLEAKEHRFARDLVRGYQASHRWSPAQEAWACHLVMEHEKETVQVPMPKTEVDDLGNISCFFAQAKAEWPCVTFKITEQLTVAISRAGKKFPGCLNVSNGKKFRDPGNVWYGRILPTGEMERSKDCTDVVLELVREFAEDPKQFVAEFGRRSGVCVFCGSALDDDRQISGRLGYGPVCAKNFNLAWNKQAADDIAPFDVNKAKKGA